jgi:hypothetical protein
MDGHGVISQNTLSNNKPPASSRGRLGGSQYVAAGQSSRNQAQALTGGGPPSKSERCLSNNFRSSEYQNQAATLDHRRLKASSR